MPDFGTPDAHDATSVSERAVIEAAKGDVALDKAVKESLLNRPLGSVKVTPEQRRQEYDLMRDNPEHLAQFFQDQSATVEQMVQYAKEMELKRG